MFALALWLSLATAIVCAVVPGGLPMTRTTGSAFDPSTTVVVLRSRPPVAVKAALLRTGEGDGVGIGGDGAVALPAISPRLVASGAIVMVVAASALTAPDFLLRDIPIALYARPPPAA